MLCLQNYPLVLPPGIGEPLESQLTTTAGCQALLSVKLDGSVVENTNADIQRSIGTS